MNIEQIRKCRSLDELQALWMSHIDGLSRLPMEQAKELIKAKDSHKCKLELFEEWSYWYDERAAIADYDGGLSREDAERQAKESILRSI